MYKVIKHFTDLQDKNHPYNVGDVFPREGLEVKPDRLAELAGSNNKQGVPLIELVKADQQDAEQEQPAEGEQDAEQEADKPKRGRKAAEK